MMAESIAVVMSVLIIVLPRVVVVCVLYQVSERQPQPLSATGQFRRTLSNLLTSLKLSHHVPCCSETLLPQLLLCLCHLCFLVVLFVSHAPIIYILSAFVNPTLHLFPNFSEVAVSRCHQRSYVDSGGPFFAHSPYYSPRPTGLV